MIPTRRRFFRLCLTCALLLRVALAPSLSPQPQRVTLTLLSTTDIHGNLYPIDYYTNQAANRGLAKMATLINQARAGNPNTLLLDCGDTIQGTTLAYYFARKDPSKPNPIVAAMNALRYDAMAVGNHEFNFGLDILWKAKREAKFPWLAANLRQTYKPNAAGYIRPYVIKEIAGVRVGIVGFTTPGVPFWEVPAHYRGYRFEQIVEAAKRVIPEVRRQVDLVVVLAHSGFDRDPATGQPLQKEIPGEDAVWELAEQVPGIDLIFFGHTHNEVPEMIINGALISQPKNWAQSLARAEVTLERDAGGHWKVVSKKSQTLRVTEQVTPDSEILQLAQPYHDTTQRYLDTPLARVERALEGRTGRIEDTPLVDLIHRVQLEAGKADVSMATIFRPDVRFEVGPITVRQLAALYPFENTLYTVEITGAQLKEALEHAAGMYPAWPPKPGQPFAPPGYQADSAEGVSYKIDLTRPVGDRIRDLTFRGNPLALDQKLRVAINNYRHSGGGGYKVYQKLPALLRSAQEVRELMIEYVSRTKRIPTETTNNWEIVPAEARQALIEATIPRLAPLAAAAGARRRESSLLLSQVCAARQARPLETVVEKLLSARTKPLTLLHVLVTFSRAD